MMAARLILASGSATRREMLRAAGVSFDIMPAEIDEPALRDALVADNPHVTPTAVAAALAAAKARDVGRRQPQALVIGSDQVLELDGEIFAKPQDAAGVRATLQRLSGRTHALHAAVALARGDDVVWSANDTATLTMRPLSSALIESYIEGVGAAVCQSVGAYQIEGRGIQLFSRIDGDHFTILGMPLLPLLQELRAQGVLAA